MNAKFYSYLSGLLASAVLAGAAFALIGVHVRSHHLVFGHEFLIGAILLLAVVQAGVQLRLFLHLGLNKSARWNLAVFISTFSLILIVVLGSLWIMNHLNYNMTPQQVNDYMMRSENMFR
ncbi:MAG: cytochrome C oxidase subunit IV family protein [Patescibacteria group bacterium]|nr:cytochrome C oxidase subunit IV family protein [Patescibacteria group bacterium]